MRTMSIACSLMAVLALACSQQPRASGKAHAGSTGVQLDQALEGDPHVVQRDVTPSSYCVACHVGYDTSGHPMGGSLPDAAAANPDWYRSAPATPEIVLVNGEFVECSSCHSDGSAGYPYRLAIPQGSVCGACHPDGDDAGVGPTVTIASPGEGATVQGMISVQGTATDDFRVEWIELRTGTGSPQAIVSSASPYSASAPFSLPFDTTSLPDGPASLLVRAYDSAGRAATATVTVSIAQPPPDTSSPSVAITSPAEGAAVRGTISVEATATDDVGVERVELWAAGALVGSVAGGASIPLDTAALGDGTVSLVVRAYDAAGNSGSAAVSVLVDNTAPAVAISSPAPGSTIRGTTTVAATASDANGVASVAFYVDGALLSTSTSAPCSAAWTPERRSGSHTLTAVATDVAGNVATSAPVSVQAK